MKSFSGSMVALATPFRNGALDEEAFRWLVQYQMDNGTSAVIPMGTTGEAVTMTADERFRTVQVAVEAAKGKIPVIGGAGSNSTAESIESVRRLREAGAAGTLIVTPYYNKPTQAGLVEHYRLVAKAHPGFPIIAYNVPGRTGVDLLPETCKRLCDIPEVVGLKEATGNMARTLDILELCGDRLTLLSGDDFTVLPFIACGGKGVISVSANVVPKLMSDLVAAARAGELARARAIQLKLNPLHRLLFVEPNPIPVKHALHLMKRFSSEIRPPLLPMTAENGAKLGAELARLGIL